MQTLGQQSTDARDIIGLIPAAGEAKRLHNLPCSKEIYPLGLVLDEGEQRMRPKVACEYLLECMRLAGAEKTFIILRRGKWDIPSYLGDGSSMKMSLAYLMMQSPFGAPYSIDQAFPFLGNNVVVFGFPDIIFKPKDAFVHLLRHQATTGADIVLGLFPADRPEKMDMVEMDENGAIRNIVIKPAATDLRHTWFIAVWQHSFTRFMHDYLMDSLPMMELKQLRDGAGPEVFVGEVIQAALRRNMKVESVTFPEGEYIDIGTPEDLDRAVHRFSMEEGL